MCTVQVLFVADVMRRTTTYHNHTIRPTARSICRKLFADDNTPSRSSSRVLRTLEAGIEQGVKQRWNFDFRTETPLPGRYQWVEIHAGAKKVPAKNSVVTEIPAATTTNERQEDATQQTASSTTKQTTCMNKTRTQSKITDFLHQRKRHRTSTDSSLTSSKLKSRRLSSSSNSSTPTSPATKISLSTKNNRK